MKTIIITLLTAFTTLSCQSTQDPKIKVLNTAEYKKEMGSDVVQLVDVRTAEEFNEGAIPGAINIDVTKGGFDLAIQKLDKSKAVFIYCRSGSRSEVAAKKMSSMGFTQIIDLEGGYLAWN
ncbi:MAG: rhodanese-like domain-containing protein [Flavobacterium sp.]